MKKSLTIQAVIELHRAIETLKQETVNRNLAYAMKRTKTETQPIWDAFTEMEKPSPVLEAFSKERVELARTFGTDNGHGAVTLKEPAKFSKAEKALRDRSPEAVKEIEEIQEAVKAKLKETVEIDLHMADYETLPLEILGLVHDGIFPMMNEPKGKDASKPE